MDGFITWVLDQAGLDASAYRAQPLNRRLIACLRFLKVHSTREAMELLNRQRELIAPVVSSLLIGVTEFFREPAVFECLKTQVLPDLIRRHRSPRIWSAACSTGAELYSAAILLAESNSLDNSFLLGTDCRIDAIAQAEAGLYDTTVMQLILPATRNKYFEPWKGQFRPVAALRRQTNWKVANILLGIEDGPWDIIFWRNASIYLKAYPAEAIWRRLASVLAPGGALIVGKAERPPKDTGLTPAGRHVYRAPGSVESISAEITLYPSSTPMFGQEFDLEQSA